MTRLRIDVTSPTADTYVVNVSSADPAWQAKPRTLGRRPDRYPVPPASESAQWQGGTHATLCDAAGDEERKSLHQRILIDPAAEEIVTFGRYLFQSLFGAAWTELRAQFPKDSFEIELRIAPEASFLDALPWELMWEGKDALIASSHSIARIVERANATATALEAPPRVLFVVGELDDDLRPGAEYIEILHSLGRQGSNGTRIPGAALPVRSIVPADAKMISEAVEKFSPHIVHFVAHGLVDDQNNAAIRLSIRDGDKVVGTELRTAAKLLELIAPDNMAPPAVVVVNACHTAAEQGLGGARALAAELVRGGVPAAIGMAGEVASSACRLFARAFYRTLAEQEPTEGKPNAPCPIQKAVAAGQLAARRFSTDANDNVEWARPSLFLASGATFPVPANQAREALIRALANIAGSSRLMLGRNLAMREYEQFIGYRGDGAKRVLAYTQSFRRENLKETEPLPYPFKLGKTTLLAQLQARALLDGYVPCLIESFQDGPRQPPPNLLYLSMRLAEVMDDMRNSFGITRRVTSHAQRLVFGVMGKEDAKYDGAESTKFEIALGVVKGRLTGSGIGANDVTADSVGRAIRRDIDQLLADVRTKCPKMKGALIMLDDVHRYHDYYQHVFDFLDQHGLGSQESPAPLIITFEDYTEEGKRVADVLVKLHGIGDFTQRAFIQPFQESPEGRLAYSQYLLSQRLCASRGKSLQQRFDDVLRDMHSEALGVPSFLRQALLVARYVEKREKPCPLAKADDEAVFTALQKEP